MQLILSTKLLIFSVLRAVIVHYDFMLAEKFFTEKGLVDNFIETMCLRINRITFSKRAYQTGSTFRVDLDCQKHILFS
jgi:hypothetical protein